MKYLLLALPLLLGNVPERCPSPRSDDVVFDGTIVATEATAYRCVVAAAKEGDGSRPGCLSVWHDRRDCNTVVHVSDGSTRGQDSPPGFAAEFCDLPLGHHTVDSCAPDGTRVTCEVDWSGSAMSASAAGSLPARYRLHVQSDAPVLGGKRTLVFESDRGSVAGTRARFTIRHAHAGNSDANPTLSACDVAPIPSQGSGGTGCAHCNAGGGEEAYALTAVLVLMFGRRRRVR